MTFCRTPIGPYPAFWSSPGRGGVSLREGWLEGILAFRGGPTGLWGLPRPSDGFRLSGEPWEGWVKVSSRYDGVTKTSDGYGRLSRGGSRGFGEGVVPRVLRAVGPWVWGGVGSRGRVGTGEGVAGPTNAWHHAGFWLGTNPFIDILVTLQHFDWHSRDVTKASRHVILGGLYNTVLD